MSTAAGGGGSRAPKPLHEYPEVEVSSAIYAHYGIDTSHFNAISYIGGDKLLMAAGKFVLCVDLRTGAVDTQLGPEDGGVGAVAVHPSRKYYVLAERTPHEPNLCVHEWPSKKCVHKLEGGAVMGYAACSFDVGGTRMAAVAAAPDFTLSVWDWASKSMILRSKCFGSDVSTVTFSRFDNSLLVTGGAGHVKFWSMANTFTGLKLQGTLGKFGRLEISDVTGFVMMPDGKVLSGAESGCLLMWEGDLVKCSFVLSIEGADDDEDGAGAFAQVAYDYEPCHAGAINAIELIHDGAIVVTAGDDGYLRYWDREELEGVEGIGLPPLYAPQCLLAVCVSPHIQIRSITRCIEINAWTVLGRDGSILTSPFPSLEEVHAGALHPKPQATLALRFNGGGITSSAVSPADHTIVTGGEDGAVRLIDYVRGLELARYALPRTSSGIFGNPVTAVRFFETDPTHSFFVSGFGDGTVCLMRRQPTAGVHASATPSLVPIGQWKPHKTGLFEIVMNANESQLCTVSRDGTAFFFTVAPGFGALQPVGFCRLPLSDPLCAEWDEHSGAEGGCLVGFEGGQVLAVSAPTEGLVDSTVSFEFPCTYALVGLRQHRLPPPVVDDGKAHDDPEEEDLLVEKDNGPWAVMFLRRLPDGGIAVGARKEELVYRYQCSVRYPGVLALPPLPPTGIEPPDYVEEPEVNLCYRGMVPYAAFIGGPAQHKELAVVCEHCNVVLRDLASETVVALAGQPHDSTSATITGAYVSYDGTMVVTTASDGLVVSQLRTGQKPPRAPAITPALPVSASVDAVPPPSLKAFAAETEESGAMVGSGLQQQLEAVTAHSMPEPKLPLSIQEQKEADDRAREAQLREERFSKFMAKVDAINQRYAKVVMTNAELPEAAQLTPEEMELDPTLRTQLEAEKQRQVTEARQEFVLEAAREDVRTRKLRNRFIDNLLCDRFLVHAFSRQFAVASFRTVDPKPATERLERGIVALHASDTDSEASGAEGDTGEFDGECISGELGTSSGLGGAGHDDPNEQEKMRQQQQQRNAAQNKQLRINGTIQQQLDKLDARRQERQQRQRGCDSLLARRPDPAVDEALLTRRRAEDLRIRGECILRTDPAYREAEEFRPTATGKLRRMIVLEKYLVEKRMGFNSRLCEVREEKAEQIKQINALRSRIAAINAQLGDNGVEASPLVLQLDEYPEKQFAVDREDLDAFAAKQQLERAKEEEAKKAQRGFGADLAGAQAGADGGDGESGSYSAAGDDIAASPSSMGSRSGHGARRSEMRSRSKSSVPRHSSRFDRGSRASTTFTAADRDRMDAELRAKLENIKVSEVEEEERAMQSELLRAERRRLAGECNKIMSAFDDTLQGLVYERSTVDADLCLADVHLLLLFREYQLLLVFRSRDKALRHQLLSVKQSREKLRREMQQLKSEMKAQETESASLLESLRENKHEAESYIQAEFLPDKVPYVLKVFNRYIKRRKHTDEDNDNDDITSDDEDDNDADDDIGEEICPPNSSEEAWEKMLAMREVRLDYTDALADVRVKSEQSKKSMDACEKSVETLAEKMQEAQKGIADLESEKRKELNMLKIVVPLSCSQVRSLDKEEMCPADLLRDDIFVVSDEELARLKRRISELAEQKAARRAEIAGMAAELQALESGRGETQRTHAEWEAKVYEVMMLKFGQRVDLEMLESCGTSRRIETKKEELRLLELRWEREVRRQERRIEALRDQLQEKLLHNTHLLQDYGDRETDRQEVERALAQATSKTVERYRGSRVATRADRSNLRELIAAQQEEMNALSAEIVVLNKKGGHAYSPAM